MNDLKPFEYCLLKYCPSYALGEQVNVGIFFFFKEDLELKFVFPNTLSRLNVLFPTTKISVLKKYFKHIESKVQTLSKNKELLQKSTLDDLHRLILTPDSSSLYFDVVKNSRYVETSLATKYYIKQYFEVYGTKVKAERKDESYLKGEFNKRLKYFLEGDKEKFALFKDNPTIKNTINSTEFDKGWQNGTTNLVKFLSFDLTDKAYFQDKSFRWYGELNQLGEQILEDNYKFDLLLTKPQDKDLFSSYDKVLKVLEEIKANKLIVEEEQLNNYIAKAVDTVKPFTHRELLKSKKRIIKTS